MRSLFLSLGFIVLSVTALNQTHVDRVGFYDWPFGELSLWHSEATYCDPSSYLTRTYKGVLAGFVPVYYITEKSHGNFPRPLCLCLSDRSPATEGYIGYTPSQSTIYVAYRGSIELQNWLDNLDVVFTDYPHCKDCQVHRGFYSAEQDSIAGVIQQVQELKQKYPNYKVVVTGHSLGFIPSSSSSSSSSLSFLLSEPPGGALATLTAMDLIKAGVTSVRLFTFGSPRVGNPEFATYVSSSITDRYRITHHRDMVPHVPTHHRCMHLSGEYYQPSDSSELMTCQGYEDESCAYQWRATNIKDHLYYLGVVLGEKGCSAIL
jgi:hypothetical protein